MTVKRLIDASLAAIASVIATPLLIVVAIGIRLASPGPVIYRAKRVGRNGRPFTLFKFRTMHEGEAGGPITASNDRRVFWLGAWIRRLKIDELPQLFNVLKGDMSLVGPRPEDPSIVKMHYTALQMETLDVLPGLTSPGSLYNYAHGSSLLSGEDAFMAYVERVLPTKLALELVYVREASLIYDLRIMGRTLVMILRIILGKKEFPTPPELQKAREQYAFI